MNITTKLSLNKHPKDCDSLSLVNATNVKVTNDLTLISNEEDLKRNEIIVVIVNIKYFEFKIVLTVFIFLLFYTEYTIIPMIIIIIPITCFLLIFSLRNNLLKIITNIKLRDCNICPNDKVTPL